VQWTCTACAWKAPLEGFYRKVEVGTDEERWDYVCPTCHATPTNIPRLTYVDKQTKKLVYFYTPTPKQTEAHLSPQRNVMYGGRAGVGKSLWLRMEAHMRCLARPGYRVLLLRRNITELRDTHLDKAETEAPLLGAKWHAASATGQYTVVYGNGSRLRFGHCETDASVKQYLSSEFDCIMLDEGATFTEFAARFIKSRLRTAKKGVIPMVRIGSNPGAMWLYNYYIAKDVTAEDDPSYNPDHYRFISASRTDNVHVNIEEQELALNQLPTEALRKMYRDGDWLAVEGQFFTEWTPRQPDGRAWHCLQELPTIENVPINRVPWINFVRVVDWGYDPDDGVCTWWALLPHGRCLATQEYTFKLTVTSKVAEEILRRSQGLKITMTIGGHDFWMKEGQTGESMAETFARAGISMYMANTDRINGWARVHSLLKELTDDGTGPVPKMQVFEPACPMLARTFPMMSGDPKTPGDLLQRQDHWVDTARWFAMSRPSSSKPTRATVWSRFSPEVRKLLMGHSEREVLGSEAARAR